MNIKKPSPWQQRLTKNFRLDEFLRNSGLAKDEMPEPWILESLHKLANRLQAVRDVLGKPINITSGYRTPAHNKAVGGAKNSFHLKGMAADIVVAGMSPREVQEALKNWSGGMGAYETFTHLDIRPYKARF